MTQTPAGHGRAEGEPVRESIAGLSSILVIDRLLLAEPVDEM